MPALTGTRTRSGSVFQRFVAPFRRSCHQLPLRMAISRRPLSSSASTLCRVICVVIVVFLPYRNQASQTLPSTITSRKWSSRRWLRLKPTPAQTQRNAVRQRDLAFCVIVVFLRASNALSERSHSRPYAAHVSSTAYAAHVRQTVAIAYDDGLFSICFSTLLIR